MVPGVDSKSRSKSAEVTEPGRAAEAFLRYNKKFDNLPE
jgi:hypothetical protein